MRRLPAITLSVAVLLALAAWQSNIDAYERYHDPTGVEIWCAECHGDFTDGTSPKGNTIPSNDKHSMHRASSQMNTECDLCHTNGDGRNPFIGSSNGTGINPGYGCAGCHGRAEDGGANSCDTDKPGRGRGLRQHHFVSNVTGCANCHTDADPATPCTTPTSGENVEPTYYGTADTNVAGACNPTAAAQTNENWTTGDFEGMDNDGDGCYDSDDADCRAGGPSPGTAKGLLVTAKNSAGSTLTITYETGLCQIADNNLYFGPVDTGAYSGADCGVGNTGTYDWNYSTAPDNAFFVLAGNDDDVVTPVEGSYGKKSDGSERAAAGLCPETQDLGNPCDQCGTLP